MRSAPRPFPSLRNGSRTALKAALLAGLSLCLTTGARAGEEAEESWNLHGQFTHVTQWHGAFKSPYAGDNSLREDDRHQATNDLTLFAGVRLWRGGEFYLNPEIDEGFGLSNTLGMAGYASGEAYKVGAHHPYFRLPRAFLRQTFDLGGEAQRLDSGANQLAGTHTADTLIVTVGKFSVTDIFDANTYAHDPRSDFLNWSVVDAGAFDYAADSWGYTEGASVEWNRAAWTLRGGLVALSKAPNGERLDASFEQYGAIGEVEERHRWYGLDGRLKLLGFVNHGRMASYADAVRLGRDTATTPEAALVRRSQSRPGMALNLEQALSASLGIFARASWNDGRKEAFDFTEINRAVAAGLSLRGAGWGRHDDTVGLAVAVNSLSSAARQYFAAGGMGILIGDGRLNYGQERILEAYYAWRLSEHFRLGADCQYVVNPAYNRDRGPVSILGLRAHAEF